MYESLAHGEEAFSMVLTTEKDDKKAKYLAEFILKKKYAACVTFYKTNSIYWWNRELEESNEVKIFIKTSKDKLNILLAAIKEIHSYQTPEIIYWDASVSQDYGNWIKNVLDN